MTWDRVSCCDRVLLDPGLLWEIGSFVDLLHLERLCKPMLTVTRTVRDFKLSSYDSRDYISSAACRARINAIVGDPKRRLSLDVCLHPSKTRPRVWDILKDVASVFVSQASREQSKDFLWNLCSVNIVGTKLTLGGNLEILAHARRLVNLYIYARPGLCYSHLSSLSGLRVLTIHDPFCTDTENLETACASLVKLEHLTLTVQALKNCGFVRTLVNLGGIDFSSTQISDISAFESLAKLDLLDISYTLVQDLEPLAKLSNIRVIKAIGTSVRDLSPIVGLNKLEDLSIRVTLIQDLSPIYDLPRLANLCISRLTLDLSVLRRLKNLNCLEAHSLDVFDFSLLQELPNLSTLSLWRTKTVNLGILETLVNRRVMLHQCHFDRAELQRIALSNRQIFIKYDKD